MDIDLESGGDVGDRFRRRALEIAAWRAESQRFPSSRSQDATERILGRWLSNVRTTARGKTGKGPSLNPSRIAALDRILPGWADVSPGHAPADAVFRDRVMKVAAFMRENGRSPRSTSEECDGLGVWLTRVRAAARGKGNLAWNPERQALVNEMFGRDWPDGEHK